MNATDDEGAYYEVKNLDSNANRLDVVLMFQEIGWHVRPQRFLENKKPYNTMLVFSKTIPLLRSHLYGGKRDYIEIADFQSTKQKRNPWIAVFEKYYSANPPDRHQGDEEEFGFEQTYHDQDEDAEDEMQEIEFEQQLQQGETELQLQARWERTGIGSTQRQHLMLQRQQEEQQQPSWAKRLMARPQPKPRPQQQTSNYQQDLLADIDLLSSGDDEALRDGFHYPDNGHTGVPISYGEPPNGNVNGYAGGADTVSRGDVPVGKGTSAFLKKIADQCKHDCNVLKIELEASNAEVATALDAMYNAQAHLGEQVKALHSNLAILSNQYTSLNATVSDISATMKWIRERMGESDGGPSKQPRITDSNSAVNTHTYNPHS
jgi:hypothetical protein